MIEVLVDDQPASRYVDEVLAHEGISWRRVDSADLIARPPAPAIILLVGQKRADRVLHDWLAAMVRAGGVLVAAGGTWGLDEILGARGGDWCDDGYLRFEESHAITTNLDSSLHVFDAVTLTPAAGTGLGSLLDSRRADALGTAIVLNRVGRGVTVTIAANLPAAIYRIQHGRHIDGDGIPPPDGTAPIDDGALKCDDGIVLSWEHDRDRTRLAAPEPACPGMHPDFPAGDTPWFAKPVADDLRALLMRALCWAAAESGMPVAMAAPWPRRLPAVGLISHDSDHNIDASARTTLRLLDEVGVRSTWCMMEGRTYPDHFSAETFRLVREAGHETALHFNALVNDGGRWGPDELQAQASWLRRTTGIERIASNKNHYTRWEGTVDCWRWFEDLGIPSDQTKGPSKKGNVGFPFGSCRPWFPLDLDRGRFLDVLEIPLQTQDLWLTTPYAVAGPILDQAVRHRGVAHFLFHQVHLDRKPEVADAMRRVTADGRSRGLEWWTAAAINDWQRLRRSVSLSLNDVSEECVRLEIEAPAAVSGFNAAVILPKRIVAGRAFSRSGMHEIRTWSGPCHNQPALWLECDLPRGITVIDLVLTEPTAD